ncbi:methylase involved in ubiquinone/menaquinone biosynthesis [Candidatus Methanoperedens nitroreducens]|uniref:Methylase involved in ubiquinone/menaquinone biosynthesis n=1 Tax=Candidatus Methanoperedens nitratireducens TaxID=1392998 RepID=A0A062V3T5_9EURY|nr:class I SAM-dependent methyltransferase [Candidatus Methanoperedens nitroreducens]KCZ71288.1 methylase involved in ubiquinone/menaquinone biosynthesis [Candidatus Methanoperedens nitroreducens]MDJ1420284.1 class I SAM-dependent methyltransferase [Candidatus Methanoperedens sp.]
MKETKLNKKFKIIEKYNDTLAPVYDKATLGEFKWIAPVEANKLILPYIKPEFSILDVGIGTGQSSAELFKAGCKICGIDISQKMLEITKKKFPDFELYLADLEEGLPKLAGRSFDVITAIGIIEFVQDINKAINLLASFLKPSGFLCLTFEEYLPDHRIQQWKKSEIGKGAIDPIPELLTFLVQRYTLKEIEDILQQHELKVLKNKRFQSYLKSNEKIPVYYWIVLAKN